MLQVRRPQMVMRRSATGTPGLLNVGDSTRSRSWTACRWVLMRRSEETKNPPHAVRTSQSEQTRVVHVLPVADRPHSEGPYVLVEHAELVVVDHRLDSRRVEQKGRFSELVTVVNGSIQTSRRFALANPMISRPMSAT